MMGREDWIGTVGNREQDVVWIGCLITNLDGEVGNEIFVGTIVRLTSSGSIARETRVSRFSDG